MATSLDPQPRHDRHVRSTAHAHGSEIHDGAVLQEDGIIAAVGTYDDLRASATRPYRDRHAATRSCCPASSTATTMSG